MLLFVSKCSSESVLLFDYVEKQFSEGNVNYYGAEKAAKYLRGHGEAQVFGICKEQMPAYLNSHGIQRVSDLGAEELEQAYLIRKDGKRHGRVYGFMRIVVARTRG